MTTIKDFKLGADPEFFVRKNGQFVSAYGLIDGTKDRPQPVDRGAVQVDGMALEFNIEPVTVISDWNLNLNGVIGQLRGMVSPDYEFVFEPIATFGEEYIEAQPEDAKKLGCTPDFNAYTGEANPTPNAEMPFRTASGHIHIGWTDGMDPNDPDHYEACRMLVKQLDVTIGVASLIWDKDTTRRQLYGKAGAFRPKSYGVEYRTISNAWLQNDWTRNLVFETARRSFNFLLKGKNLIKDFNEDYIQEVINTSNIDEAIKILGGHFVVDNQSLWDKITEYTNANKKKQARDELGRWKKLELHQKLAEGF